MNFLSSTCSSKRMLLLRQILQPSCHWHELTSDKESLDPSFYLPETRIDIFCPPTFLLHCTYNWESKHKPNFLLSARPRYHIWHVRLRWLRLYALHFLEIFVRTRQLLHCPSLTQTLHDLWPFLRSSESSKYHCFSFVSIILFHVRNWHLSFHDIISFWIRESGWWITSQIS